MLLALFVCVLFILLMDSINGAHASTLAINVFWTVIVSLTSMHASL